LLSPDLTQKVQRFIFFDLISKNKIVERMIEEVFNVKENNTVGDFSRENSGYSG